MVHSEGLMMAH